MKKILFPIISIFLALCLSSCPSEAEKTKTENPPAASNFKRGVGYNFTTLRPGQDNDTTYTEQDMDLLMSGAHGISWFYTWGLSPNPAVMNAAKERALDFIPMAWNDDYDVQTVRDVVAANPNIKYIMAFNEPNFEDQANMTPKQAADAWTKLKGIANELGLKIISPAMNFGPHIQPEEWLDEFRQHIGEADWDEIHAINVHIYPFWPSAVKGILNMYRKYNKPIWLTEFCGWEDLQDWRVPNTWELQAWYLSLACIYLEMDPLVERYAWYMPKGHVPESNPATMTAWGTANNPFHNLITEVNATGPLPELTPLGIIYTNMTTLNKTVWVPAGQKIDAAQFTNCNMEEHIGIDSWADVVEFRPTNDTDKTAGVLEIMNFKWNNASNNPPAIPVAAHGQWIEYQVNLPTTKTYTLTLRYRTEASTNITITVDGGAAVNTTLNSASYANSNPIDLGNLTAGNRIIRLQIANTGGNCAINWLRID